MLRDLDFSKYTHVWILPNYTDMRQGIDKLAAIIQYQLHLDAYDEHALFLFCGKRRSRLKALAFEGLSEDFCYPLIFQIIAMSSRKPSGKCADKSFYLRPQSLAISFSSSGHSFSSFLEITRPSPCSITAFFCSREGKA